MSLFSSLTNRIFLGTALLVLIATGVAIYRVSLSVRAQAESNLRAGLNEATMLVDELLRLQFRDFVVKSKLIADVPLLKGAAATEDPPTVHPIAQEYQATLGADLFVVVGRNDAPARASRAHSAGPSGAHADSDRLPVERRRHRVLAVSRTASFTRWRFRSSRVRRRSARCSSASASIKRPPSDSRRRPTATLRSRWARASSRRRSVPERAGGPGRCRQASRASSPAGSAIRNTSGACSRSARPVRPTNRSRS